jgi:Protein of unknown function (DUF3489)
MTTMTTETSDSRAAVAAQGASVGPEKPVTKKAASRKKGSPQAPKMTKGAKASKQEKRGKKPARKAAAPHRESKTGTILEMIGRAKGATLAEIMTATGWQAHSVRGFISTAGKKHQVKIESSKTEAGERLYREVK